MSQNTNIAIRPGCQDMWNAYLLKNASYVIGSDFPICNSNTNDIPKELISYEDAKHLYKTKIKKEPDFHIDAYIHFYIDDQKFDGPRSSIWLYPEKALDIIRHFSGAITPDFSTNLDFLDGFKRYNTLRMRAFGHWLVENDIPIINNVRWGTEETWEYCFDGIPYNSIVAIGTVASGINKLKNRPLFENGLFEMVSLLKPHTIIVYGSANYPCFKELEKCGIKIFSFPSKTNLAFATKKGDEF